VEHNNENKNRSIKMKKTVTPKKQCPKGYRWCPIEKKCVREDNIKGQGRRQQRGQGKGPMGQPQKGQGKGPIGQPRRVDEMDQVKEASQLVDVILKGDYKEHLKIQAVVEIADIVLDEVENKIDTVPDQDMASLQQDVEDELSKDEGVTQIEEKIALSISRLIKEEDYREYFKGMLKKYKVTNPSDLDGEKKKEFFNAVDKGWKAKKETD